MKKEKKVQSAMLFNEKGRVGAKKGRNTYAVAKKTSKYKCKYIHN